MSVKILCLNKMYSLIKIKCSKISNFNKNVKPWINQSYGLIVLIYGKVEWNESIREKF